MYRPIENSDDPALIPGAVVRLRQDHDEPYQDAIVVQIGEDYITLSRPYTSCVESPFSNTVDVFTRYERYKITKAFIDQYNICIYTNDLNRPHVSQYYITNGSETTIFAISCSNCGHRGHITTLDERSFFPDGNYGKTPNQCPECHSSCVDVWETRLKK